MLARKKKPDLVLNWHPNFRDVATLPDIKQVRTGFLVNFVAIVFALVALGATLYFEVDIYKVNHEIAGLNNQIESNDSANKKALAYTKSFVSASKSMQFTARFFSQKLPPLELLASLMDSQPDNIIFRSIYVESIIRDFGGKKAEAQRVTISGTLSSESELGLQEFVDKVLASPAFKSRIGDPIRDRQISASRDAASGTFEFNIVFTLKPAP